jgi:hypothetical protein
MLLTTLRSVIGRNKRVVFGYLRDRVMEEDTTVVWQTPFKSKPGSSY